MKNIIEDLYFLIYNSIFRWNASMHTMIIFTRCSRWNDKNPDGKFNTSPNLSISRILLGHELWIRMGSKDYGISIRWMGPVRGYLCRGMYCLRASISFTYDAMENKSPTDSVILGAILTSRTVYAQNDTRVVCVYTLAWKKIDHAHNAWDVAVGFDMMQAVRLSGISRRIFYIFKNWDKFYKEVSRTLQSCMFSRF